MCAQELTHISKELADKSKLADEETLVICRLLVYLWRGQMPLRRDKGGSLAIPACNKQHNSTLVIKKKTLNQLGFGVQDISLQCKFNKRLNEC